MPVKKYKVIAFPNVYDEIKAIEDYIYLDSPPNAVKVRNRILRTIIALNTFPFRYHQDYLRSSADENYRLVNLWSYNIHYKVEEKMILVFHVSSTHQNPIDIAKKLKEIK